MKRLPLSHLFKSWRRPRRVTIPNGTYRLRKIEEGRMKLIPLSAAEQEKAAEECHYWAIVDERYPVTAPWTLVRQRGSETYPECFNGKEWSRTDIFIKIEWGREDREAVRVSSEEAERITRFLVERWEAVRLRAEGGTDA